MDPSLLDMIWVILSAALVFLMQAGFLCLESGLTRAKNNIDVAIKNLSDLGASVLLYWGVGFALMFGLSQGGWIGASDFFPPIGQGDAWLATFFIFQAMFCATSVTILSGAVAERMRFGGYLVVTLLISGLIYPIYGHWAWNGAQSGGSAGWLGRLGFVDFAGSTVVHSVGGWVALAALLIIGSREGRFPVDGVPRKITGSNLPMAILGVILLWLGWFGFNGGSTLAFNEQVPGIVANTVLGGAGGGMAALTLGWWRRGRADVDLLINGSLAGLVAITANCQAVTALSAVVIGGVGGIVMLFVGNLLERFHIDDAVGAIPVHLGAGIWGTLAVALFGDPEFLGTGLGLGGQLGIQTLGIIVCGAWAFGVGYLVLRIIHSFSPLRVTPEQERVGLNVSEHGATTELLDLLTAMDHQEKTGEIGFRVPVEPFTEVGQIAGKYNRVMHSVEQLNRRNELILSAAGEGVYGLDLQGNTTFVNPAAARMIGWKIEELLGKHQHTLLHHSKPDGTPYPELECPIYAATQDGEVHHVDREVFWRKDGTSFPVEYTSSPIQKQGRSIGAVVVFQDITERKKAEKALRSAKELAEVANQAKSDFLATMSHEIRTPLNGITGMMELVLETELTEEQQEHLRLVKSSANALLRLINDILDYSSIESGRVMIERVPFDLQRVVEEVRLLEGIRAREKGIELSMECADELPSTVVGDPVRIRQTVANLVNNAVKFTEKGHVRIKVGCEERGKTKGWFRIAVEDTGIGISEDKHDHIFDKFTQADSSTTRRYGGTGLGLAICRQLVGLMGGTIGVSSHPGEGATFWFTLCLSFKPNKEISLDPTQNGEAKKDSAFNVRRGSPHILVAEDNLVNQKVAVLTLEKLGCQVDLAVDGKEAVEKMGEQSYDIVLMDCQMPRMDGFEATAEIRRREGSAGRHTPILAMTANAMQGDRERCLATGMDDYLSKPVTQEDFRRMLERWLTKEQPASVDIKVLSRLQEDVGEEFGEIIDFFLRETPNLIADLREAIVRRDVELLYRTAHSIKSSSSNMGAKILASLSKEVEILGREGKTEVCEVCDDRIRAIEEEYSRVRDTLGEKREKAR